MTRSASVSFANCTIAVLLQERLNRGVEIVAEAEGSVSTANKWEK